jgi:hypothetical protein
MARRSAINYEKRSGPVPYGIWARLTDIWSARRDRSAVISLIQTPGANRHQIAVNRVITPYMEVRNRHFLDWAEGERRRMYTELAGTYQRQAKIQAEVEEAEKKAKEVHQVTASLPAAPAEPLRRNVLEQNAPEALIRARRQREFDAERARILAPYQQATNAVASLRVEAAELEARVAAREQILYSQVRQLHEYARRRCGTYMQHLVAHQQKGGAIIPYLKLALPELPAWVPPEPR